MVCVAEQSWCGVVVWCGSTYSPTMNEPIRTRHCDGRRRGSSTRVCGGAAGASIRSGFFTASGAVDFAAGSIAFESAAADEKN